VDLSGSLFGDANGREYFAYSCEGGRGISRWLWGLIAYRRHHSQLRARVYGDGRQGLAGSRTYDSATDCNRTVAKPYLFGGKGDQLRANAESPKVCNRMGGKGLIN
jgi:hypothetical protein